MSPVTCKINAGKCVYRIPYKWFISGAICNTGPCRNKLRGLPVRKHRENIRLKSARIPTAWPLGQNCQQHYISVSEPQLLCTLIKINLHNQFSSKVIISSDDSSELTINTDSYCTQLRTLQHDTYQGKRAQHRIICTPVSFLTIHFFTNNFLIY